MSILCLDAFYFCLFGNQYYIVRFESILLCLTFLFLIFMFRLHGNPLCAHANQLHIVQLCRSQIGSEAAPKVSSYTTALYTEASYTKEPCPIQSCPEDYEYVKDSPVRCFCAAPIRVGFRMKSPGFSDFSPYEKQFQVYLTSGLHINLYQLSVVSFVWETGPRLRMYLKLFPEFNNRSNTFNESEIQRINGMFTGWTIPNSDIFGPHELLDFTLLGPYAHGMFNSPILPAKILLCQGYFQYVILGLCFAKHWLQNL